MKILKPLFSVLILVFLGACSLADDITPPPGARQEVIQATQAPASTGPNYPLVAPDSQAGEALYAEKCAPCHGQTGLGNGPQADQLPNPAAPIGEPELARQATPAEWYEIVTQGNIERFMPPFGNSLSDRQRWDVVAYSFSLSASAEEASFGGEIYTALCVECHGADGRSQGTGPDFTDQAAMSNKSMADHFEVISQGAEGMPAFEDELNEEERWAAASYLRTFTFAPAGHGLAQAGPTGSAGTPSEPPSSGETITTTETVSATEGLVTITGAVLNGATGLPLTELPVTMHGFDGMQIVYTQTVQTSSQGVYTFEAVETAPDRVFLTYTEYEGATYASNIARSPEEGSVVTLDIEAFDTTTDTSVLSVDRMHLFFDFAQPESVQVVELYILSNPSDKAVVAEQDGGPVTPFTLPEGASNPEFQDGALGQRYVATPGGFADTLPVQPTLGEYQVLYYFNLPYTNKTEIKQTLPLPVESVIILLPDEGVKIKGDQMEDAGIRPVQGINYRMYNSGPYEAGSTLSLTLSGRPGSDNLLGSLTSNQSLVIGLGAFGLALVVAGVWLMRRNQSETEAELAEAEMESPADPEELVDAIIALDDLYRDGKLPEEAYRQRRAELKAQLVEAQGKEID